MLQKIDGGQIGVKREQQILGPQAALVGKSIKTLHLVILGNNELFGLEEIVLDQSLRGKTVTCISEPAKCYFITKENFIHCVNQFRFSQNILEEQIIKHKLYNNRMIETHEFQ